MSSNNLHDLEPLDRSDWNSAWEIVSRLAAVREAALSRLDQDTQIPSSTATAHQQASAQRDAGRATMPSAAVDPAQLALAVAEIERASAALRRNDPTLEAWKPQTAGAHAMPAPRSVWVLIGGLWLSASLMVAAAAGAIIFMFG